MTVQTIDNNAATAGNQSVKVAPTIAKLPTSKIVLAWSVITQAQNTIYPTS